MREYGTCYVTKQKTARGIFWRGYVHYRDGEDDPWRRMTKILEDERGDRIQARPGEGDNRGKATAERALQAWRESLAQAERDAEQRAIAEAERAEREAQERAQAEAEAARRVTVADYIDRYLDRREALREIEPSTMVSYRHEAKKIRREFGKTYLQDLTRGMVQDFYSRMMTGEPYLCDGEKRHRPLGPNGVRKAHALLKMVCRYACEYDELIDRNPTAGVKPPKMTHPEKNAMDTDSRERFTKYVTQCVPTDAVTGAAMALWAGLGTGEACAVKWRDVDLYRGTLRVDESIGQSKDGTYSKAPKVAARRRTVYMPAQLVDVLKRRRELAIDECTRAGVAFSGELYVLGDATGAHKSPVLLAKRWSAIAETEGYRGTIKEHVRMYDLRHTYATVAVANHVDVETVASAMGHSNVAMTLNTYASSDPEAQSRAALRIEKAYKTPKVIHMEPNGTEG